MSAPQWATLPRVFAALLVLYVVLEWGFRADAAADLVFLVLAITAIWLAFRLMRKSIWRLRNRLYVTWIFIGVVPIVLILALAAIGTYIVTGQVAVYLVSSELDRRAESLAVPVRILTQTKPADRSVMTQQMGRFLGVRMPGIQVAVLGDRMLHYPSDSTLETPPAAWTQYTGYVLKDGVYFSAAIAKTEGTTAIALAPIDSGVLKDIVPGIGLLRLGSGPFAGAVPTPASGWEKLDFMA